MSCRVAQTVALAPTWRQVRRVPRSAIAVVLVGVASVARAAPAPSSLPGWPLYDRFCVACHGARGDGGGPAAPWLDPRPRDLTRGAFAWRTVDVGAPAPRDDLARTIQWGAPGTAMPGFAAVLAPAEIDQLVDVVAAFAPAAAIGRAPSRGHAQVELPPEQAQRGATLWRKDGCAACHGDGGRGDGPAAAKLVDGAGAPRPPYDLTAQPLRRPRPGDAAADIA